MGKQSGRPTAMRTVRHLTRVPYDWCDSLCRLEVESEISEGGERGLDPSSVGHRTWKLRVYQFRHRPGFGSVVELGLVGSSYFSVEARLVPHADPALPPPAPAKNKMYHPTATWRKNGREYTQ